MNVLTFVGTTLDQGSETVQLLFGLTNKSVMVLDDIISTAQSMTNVARREQDVKGAEQLRRLEESIKEMEL